MIFQALIAYLVDLLIGDPKFLPHPVVLIGKFIAILENGFKKISNSPQVLFISGIIIVVITVLGTFITTLLFLQLLTWLHPVISYIAGIWIISTTIAARGLLKAAADIRKMLLKGYHHSARQKVGMIVGRDTRHMNHSDVCRATVETVAENTVDAVIAPLFYGIILGPAGAIVYRAVNTLDSMLGYKEGDYLYLGWAAAKLDDIANYIPARLTGLFMLAAVYLTGRNTKKGYRVLLKDAKSHPSPNAGITESITAGALDITLGGLNYYYGQESFRAYLGNGSNEINTIHINSGIDLMILTSFLFSFTVLLLYLARVCII